MSACERLVVVCTLVVAACVCGVWAQDDPEITMSILPDVKRFGMTGSLNCSVISQGIYKLVWIHQERSLSITTDNSVTVDKKFNPIKDGLPKYEIFRYHVGDGYTYVLMIHRLDRRDNGTYVCQIQGNVKQKITRKEGEMVVLIAPSIQQGVTTQVVVVPENGNATMNCEADGFPQPNITWVRPNGKTLPGSRYFSFRGNTLHLFNITRDDRGVYRCVADNTVRPTGTYDATLYVEFEPYSRAVQSSYGQALNMQFDLTIECIIAGNPPPILRWYKVQKEGGLRPIHDDDKHVVNTLLSHGQTLSISEVWSQLKIINVQAGDLGDYKCEGSNRRGYHQANIYVYETSECQGANCPDGYGINPGAASAVTVSVLTMAFGLILSISL